MEQSVTVRLPGIDEEPLRPRSLSERRPRAVLTRATIACPLLASARPISMRLPAAPSKPLRELRPAHLRVELPLDSGEWETSLARATDVQRGTDCALEIALSVDKASGPALESLAIASGMASASPASWCLRPMPRRRLRRRSRSCENVCSVAVSVVYSIEALGASATFTSSISIRRPRPSSSAGP